MARFSTVLLLVLCTLPLTAHSCGPFRFRNRKDHNKKRTILSVPVEVPIEKPILYEPWVDSLIQPMEVLLEDIVKYKKLLEEGSPMFKIEHEDAENILKRMNLVLKASGAIDRIQTPDENNNNDNNNKWLSPPIFIGSAEERATERQKKRATMFDYTEQLTTNEMEEGIYLGDILEAMETLLPVAIALADEGMIRMEARKHEKTAEDFMNLRVRREAYAKIQDSIKIAPDRTDTAVLIKSYLSEPQFANREIRVPEKTDQLTVLGLSIEGMIISALQQCFTSDSFKGVVAPKVVSSD
eukprot:Filipodium_phascolosomae@DN1519_c0_g1_i2.p1